MFSAYIISVAIFVGIWVTLALSLNIFTGYAGQVSLGHAAFFGIGAYTSAILSLRYGLPFWVDLLGAIVVTGLIGTVLGLPSLRVRHDFLVLATMGINFVVVAVFKYVDFFGGAMGLINIPAPSILGYSFRGGFPYLALVWAFATFAWLVSWYVSKTWVGLAFHTVRLDEDAAAAVGVSVPRFKVYAFAISSALAGGAGCLYGHFIGSLFPGTFVFVESIVILSMVIFGGVGTLRGPILGAIILKAAPELLRVVQDYRFTIYGALLVLMMLFQPMGLIGDDSFLWRSLTRLFSPRGGGGPRGGVKLPPQSWGGPRGARPRSGVLSLSKEWAYEPTPGSSASQQAIWRIAGPARGIPPDRAGDSGTHRPQRCWQDHPLQRHLWLSAAYSR